jgi:hypothetical protein
MTDTDTDVTPEEDEDDGKLDCCECGKEITSDEDMSSYCGSICSDCVSKHARQCGVCRADFLGRGIVDESDLEDTDKPAKPCRQIK